MDVDVKQHFQFGGMAALFSYPVEAARLDIVKQFLTPNQCSPKQHKTLEATEIMLQLIAADREVAALPQWLVEKYAITLPIKALRLGENGLQKNNLS